jgi:hypothetical protein
MYMQHAVVVCERATVVAHATSQACVIPRGPRCVLLRPKVVNGQAKPSSLSAIPSPSLHMVALLLATTCETGVNNWIPAKFVCSCSMSTVQTLPPLFLY